MAGSPHWAPQETCVRQDEVERARYQEPHKPRIVIQQSQSGNHQTQESGQDAGDQRSQSAKINPRVYS
jgi:hypothetical protein